MSKQHLRVILNGKAALRDDVRRAVDAVRKMGHTVSVRVTWEAGDTQRLALEALDEAAEDQISTLVAAGGDGTVNEIVAALLDGLQGDKTLPFELAVLPLGTANDFARGVGLDPSDILGCLRFAARCQPKPTDVGSVNGRAFINMATGGFGASVTSETDPNLKRVLGGAAYLFTGLHRFSELASSHGAISAEDFSWRGDFLAIAVGNGKQAGGGVELCPDALLDDGFLDLTIVPYPRGDDVADLLGRLIEYGPDGLRDSLIMRRVKAVIIETDKPLQFNLDGEPIHDTRLEVSVLPKKIGFRRP
ncbi:lipid kinase YegS [Roseibium hamelinense]|uniref:Lipid kinase YegS n=1 Tax=Roseibium hamelinense TaxID=150831 RepID=A0A562T297_9HYPH|nr:lipid kinase YegS [Roseibium hamelinense]MTI44708.1 lipid kinase YegS [Roseibium hamelinense]TWI87338.1 lipid kinase YegS [Roseibium hamelinense]